MRYFVTGATGFIGGERPANSSRQGTGRRPGPLAG